MRLFFLLFTLAATTLAGSFIVVALALEMPGWQPIVIAAVVGTVAALPAAWWAKEQISKL